MAGTCYDPPYLPASFKGVPFLAEEVTSEHGRRGAEGEFPFGESTAYADLGRKIRRYTLNGRYQENNHVAASAALIAACESPGPGLLVHPTRGAILVACTKLSITDDPLLGQGITTLAMEFVEANLIATGASFGIDLFALSTVALSAALYGSFFERYRMDTVRFYHVDTVLDTSAAAIEAVRVEFAKAIAQTEDNSKWTALSVMQSLVDDPSKMRNAKDAYDAFERAMRTLSNATAAQQKYDSFKAIANKLALVSTLPVEAGDAQDAVYMSARVLAVAYMARAAMETPVETLSEALDVYDEVIELIDQELAAARATCEDGLYYELRQFQTATKTALLNRAYNLPSLVEYDFSGTVHSLVAAYEIFDDAKRFGEIEMRNPSYFPWAVGPKVIASRA